MKFSSAPFRPVYYFALAVLAAVLFFCGAARVECAETAVHNIVWGDTLAKIAVRYYGSARFYPALAAANRINNPHLIIAGKLLTIPPAEVLEPPPVAEQPPAAPPPSDAAPPALPAIAVAEEPAFVWRKVENSAFTVGEHLTFEIKWQFITAGIATMEIREISAPPAPALPRPSYKIITEARSTPFIDNFFKVRDVNTSYLDVESICSHGIESDLSEGNFAKKEAVYFDQIKRTFALSDGRSGATEPWVQDALGSLYYVRTLALAPGAEFSFPAHSGDRTYPLVVKVLAREKVRVPAGEFDCFKLEPALRMDSVFKAQGRIWVWVTADARRMPVRMQSQVFIGSVDAVLKEYKTGSRQ